MTDPNIPVLNAAASAAARVASGASTSPTGSALPNPMGAVNANNATNKNPSPQSVTGINKTDSPNATESTLTSGVGSGDFINDNPKATGPKNVTTPATSATQPTPINTAPPVPTVPDVTKPSTNPGATVTPVIASNPTAYHFNPDDTLGNLEKAGNDKIAGMGAMQDDFQAAKTADINAANANAALEQQKLKDQQKILEQIDASRQAAIQSGAVTDQATVDANFTAAKSALDAQQAKTTQAFKDATIAQALDNKRREIGEETAIGQLGGNFTTAGVADINDTILQGEHAIVSLQMNNDIANQGFTNQAIDLQNNYKADTLKVNQYKTDEIGKAYSDLEAGIGKIMDNQVLTEEQKNNAIQQADDNYNKNMVTLHSDIVNAKYQMALDYNSQAEKLKADALAQSKLEKSQARAAAGRISSGAYGNPATFTPTQLNAWQQLLKKAGYDPNTISNILRGAGVAINQTGFSPTGIGAALKAAGDVLHTGQSPNAYDPNVSAEENYNNLTKNNPSAPAWRTATGKLSATAKKYTSLNPDEMQSKFDALTSKQDVAAVNQDYQQQQHANATDTEAAFKDNSKRVLDSQQYKDAIDSGATPADIKTGLKAEFGVQFADRFMKAQGY